MSLKKVLENWSDDDNKKRKKVDAEFFSCSESWEVDYLVAKTLKVYPYLNERTLRAAIQYCCQEVEAPRPREQFVACVLKRLALI